MASDTWTYELLTSNRFQHMVSRCRSTERGRIDLSGISVDIISGLASRENTAALSQLLSHHRRNLHGCEFQRMSQSFISLHCLAWLRYSFWSTTRPML